MHTKSIRVPEEMLAGIKLVEDHEHIEESTAIRKLIRIGLEAYVANLYRQGEITLREASRRLNLDMVATLDMLIDYGVSGNLDASDVLSAIENHK
jgi:hypothetical protein